MCHTHGTNRQISSRQSQRGTFPHVLRIDFVTLFPEMMLVAQRHSMLERAEIAGLVSWNAANPRDFCYDRHAKVDDSPYGGEAGMLLRVEPIALALNHLGISREQPGHVVIVTDPAGIPFQQKHANQLANSQRIAILCGHYEGFDHRVVTELATYQFSLGDFVLTGGELPALMMADAIVRQVPGVLGNEASLASDSFREGLLSAPNYTRPEIWNQAQVPPELRSGDHKQITKWRRTASLLATKKNRPDLFARATLAKSDLDLLS